MTEYGSAPDTIVEVPKPVTLLGSFSDYVDGFSLMCAISDGIVISASLREDNSIRIYNAAKQDKKKFILSSIKYRREDKWANAVKATVLSFQSAGYKLTGMNIVIAGSASAYGDVMNAMIFAGLSSLINELYELNLPHEELFMLARGSDAFTSACSVKERDLVAIFESEEDSLLFFDLNKREHSRLEGFSSFCPDGYILDSSIPSSVMMPLLEEFRSDIVQVFASLRQAFPKERSLLALSEKEIRMYSGCLPELDRHYIEYILEESNIAKKGYELFLNGDLKGFGHLLSQQQRNLINKAELTSPETDWLVKRAQELPTVLGIAQISLGKPGVMLVLIESDSEVEYTNRLEEYDRIFGFQAVLRRFAPSGSIRKIS